MGHHTWFYKDKKKNERREYLEGKLEDHGSGIIYLDSFDYHQADCESREILEEIETEYYDTFRTWKRDDDGCYTEDTICSLKEFYVWIEENKECITFYGNKEYAVNRVIEFFNEYENGIITFG